jgi:hypothetical protein
LLPKRFLEQFQKLGINNIDDYLVSLPVEVHKEIHGGGALGGAWNYAWAEWLRLNPFTTPVDVFNQVRVFIHEFGLDGIIKVVEKKR